MKILKKLLDYFNFNIPGAIKGIIIPVLGGVGVQNIITTEKWMPSLLERINKNNPIGTLIDVGVNIGQTYIKFKNINKTGMYVGFEPNPVCFVYSKRLLEVNGDFRSVLIPTGLSDKTGLTSFFASSQASSDGTMIENLRHNNSNILKQIIPVVIFDDVSNDIELPGNIIIKIDVEGAEKDVVRGMSKFITERQPIIICEVLHADAADKMTFNRENNLALLAVLSKLDYSIYRIQKDVDGRDFSGVNPVNGFSEGIWDPINSPKECDYMFAPAKLSLEFLK